MQAILKVLPNARIGVHIGVAHEKGWIPLFLKHCRQYNLKCDFVGISRYRILDQSNANPQGIEEWLASLTKVPAWLPGTALEIHESGIDPGPDAEDKEVQQMPYYTLFANHLLQNPHFGQWFKGMYVSSACLEWMETVLNQPMYKCNSMGKTKAQNGWVGAILTRDQAEGSISVMIFNYNLNSVESGVENVILRLSNMPKSALKNYGIEAKFYRSDKLMETKQLMPATVVNGALKLELPVVANSIVTLKIQ